MPIAGIAIGLADLFVDLVEKDEKKRRLAHAAIAAGIGAALSPLDPTAAAVGGVLTAKELAALALHDSAAKGIVDAGGGVLATAMGGSAEELVKTAGGAAAGAAIGGAVDGKRGIASGLTLGGTMASGHLEQIAAKTAGAGVGAAIAHAAAPKAQERDAIVFGMKLGASVGGNAADLAAGDEALKQAKALSKSFITHETPNVDLHQQGAIGLTGNLSGAGAGGVVYLARKDRDERSALDALETGESLGRCAAGAIKVGEAVKGGDGRQILSRSLEAPGSAVAAAADIAAKGHEAEARAFERRAAEAVHKREADEAKDKAEKARQSAENADNVASAASDLGALASSLPEERFEIYDMWKKRA